jgi:hypothetical protein
MLMPTQLGLRPMHAPGMMMSISSLHTHIHMPIDAPRLKGESVVISLAM